jgi:hypothetical protein
MMDSGLWHTLPMVAANWSRGAGRAESLELGLSKDHGNNPNTATLLGVPM